jgi:hypothetical protein
MNCPLCGAELLETYNPTADSLGTLCSRECPTDFDKNKFYHYSIDDYGIQIVVLPYIIKGWFGNSYWELIEVDSDGVQLRATNIPEFKIPTIDKFIEKVKILLVFS